MSNEEMNVKGKSKSQKDTSKGDESFWGCQIIVISQVVQVTTNNSKHENACTFIN